MLNAIYFDLDGTLANLYGVQNWEEKLHSSNSTPYRFATPLVDMEHLNNLLEQFQELGVTIGIISWLAKGSSKEYDKQVRQAKRQWVELYLPCATEVHFVKYGTPKHYVCKVKDNALLVDDNAQVCDNWTRGDTICPQWRSQDIPDKLERLLVDIL